MKWYIAGKINGDPEYRDKFRAAEEAVRERDAEAVILNPAELPEGMAPGDYIKICLSMLDSADMAVFLPDWISSAGAKIEHAYARYVGMRIAYLEQLAD